MKHLTCAPLYDRLLALPAIIIQGWKGLRGTNALAYDEQAYTAVKSFIMATGSNVITLFSPII